MSNLYFGHYPGVILSYDQNTRSAKVSVEPITTGSDKGLNATFCYAIGEDDRDTEIYIKAGDEVWVFFEEGHPHAAVIAGFRSHGKGAEVDVRRIRQENIELLATKEFKLIAENINLYGTGHWYGDVHVHGNFIANKITTAGGTDLDSHDHGGVRSGDARTAKAKP